MFNRRPNIARLARRNKVEKIIAALSYRDVVSVRNGRVDLGAPVRRDALRALSERDDPDSTAPFIRVVVSDPDSTVRETAIVALRGHTEPDVLEALLDGVCGWRDPHLERARRAALVQLQEVPAELAPSLASLLIERAPLTDLDEDEKWTAREIIGHDEQKTCAATPVLARRLTSSTGRTGRRAADILVELAPWGVVELIDALADDSLAGPLARVLARRRDGHAAESLIGLLGSEDPMTRKAAAAALGELREPRAVEALLGAVNDESFEVRTAATTALDQLGTIAVIASMTAMLRPSATGFSAGTLTESNARALLGLEPGAPNQDVASAQAGPSPQATDQPAHADVIEPAAGSQDSGSVERPADLNPPADAQTADLAERFTESDSLFSSEARTTALEPAAPGEGELQPPDVAPAESETASPPEPPEASAEPSEPTADPVPTRRRAQWRWYRL